MNFPKFSIYLLITVPFLTIAIASSALADSKAELWNKIKEQEKLLQEFKEQLTAMDEKTEAVAHAIETRSTSSSNSSGAGSSTGWFDKTSLGGYGELHYNGGDRDEIDFHRFVAFINHNFTDKIRLYSEVELEHSFAADGADGAVELEQAYIEFDVAEEQRLKAGLFLVPVGLLNETHEPTTFFGVERNPVETSIIPTTWWEAGVGASGKLSEQVAYDIGFHSGLETPIDGDSAFLIRSGRQRVSEATATDGAVTARLRYYPDNGVELGVVGHFQNDITQRALDSGVSAVLLSATADIKQGPFGFRALYANWDLDGEEPEAIGRDQQTGWYVEPSYTFSTSKGDVGVFGRYNSVDNNAGDSNDCLLYTSPSPRDQRGSRMPSSA